MLRKFSINLSKDELGVIERSERRKKKKKKLKILTLQTDESCLRERHRESEGEGEGEENFLLVFFFCLPFTAGERERESVRFS